MATDPTRLALIVSVLLLLLAGPPSAAVLGLLMGLGVLVTVSTVRSVRTATILVLLVGALVIRIAVYDQVGSDVLWVTEAAVRVVAEGGNPYGIGYRESSPDGAPFPYGPVALLWYVPLRSDPELTEFLAAALVCVILALRGRLVGLAVYATSTVLLTASVDGSNDTSLGLLLLLAILVAERWPAAGAALLAGAVAFKLSAVAFVPAFIAWGGFRIGLAFVALSLVTWAPVIGSWGVASFVRSIEMANDAHPTTVTWSLGRIVRAITGARLEMLDQLRFVFGGAVALASLSLRPSLDTVILAGSAVYLVTLYGGNWGSYAYIAGIAPLICWRLDDWLGLPSRPLLPPAWTARLSSFVPMQDRGEQPVPEHAEEPVRA